MGKTYRRDSEEKFSNQRPGKRPKRIKSKGKLKTLNSNVEYDYDDYFDDEVELRDEIHIRHNKHTT